RRSSGRSPRSLSGRGAGKLGLRLPGERELGGPVEDLLHAAAGPVVRREARDVARDERREGRGGPLDAVRGVAREVEDRADVDDRGVEVEVLRERVDPAFEVRHPDLRVSSGWPGAG